MVLIYAEKPDMGTKIAAALDHITLSNGTAVRFNELNKYEEAIKKQRRDDGYFRIRYCGEDAVVTWGMGHMCELKQAADYDSKYKSWREIPLPYIPKRYELKLIESTKSQFYRVKELLKKAGRVIVATDNDREGDLIAHYVFTYAGYKKPYQRVLFNRQSAEEFRKAFDPANLISSEERKPVIDAGRARSAGDFIVGAGPTVAMSLYFPYRQNGKPTVVSVGRVQTATLNLVNEREREIEVFRPTKYYVAKGKFTGQNGTYEGVYEEKKIPTRVEASLLLDELEQCTECRVEDVKRTVSTKAKPHLYSLQSLQMDANKMYGISLADTLAAAQSLYDKGYTTYPRTEVCYLTTDSLPDIDRAIDALLTLPEFSHLRRKVALNKNDKQYFDDAKCAENSHCAIVPTGKIPASIPLLESRIYTLIAKNTLCMVYPPAKIAKTSITTIAGGGSASNGRRFVTNGSEVVEAGHFEVIGQPKDVDIPNVKKGDTVKGEFRIEEKETEPPKRFTDGSLLNAMMTCGKTIDDEELKAVMAKGSNDKPRGLGRPSTQASIVERLLSRGYISRSGKTIKPTEKGRYMMENLPVKELKSPVMTARWEKRLDDIENGKDTYEAFMKDLENSVASWTMTIVEEGKKNAKKNPSFNAVPTPVRCPICGGVVVNKGEYYTCENYPSCRFAVSKYCGHKFGVEEIQTLLNGGSVAISDAYSKSKDKHFSCVIKLKSITDGRMEYEFVNEKKVKLTSVVCPKCGKPLADKTDIGDFYGCTGYPSCRFTFPLSPYGHKFTEAEIRDMLDGKTIHVDDAYSKKKKTSYSCNISANVEGDNIKFNITFDKK